MQPDWDHLRYFLAVCRHGSVRRAARELRVNHTTIARRLDALEGELGVRLLERLPGGYVPTPAGEVMRVAVERAAEAIDNATHSVAGGDTRLSGTVRLTLPDALVAPAARWLMRVRTTHPAIQVQMVANNTRVDLLRREADIALRVAERPPPDLVGHRMARIALAVYASKAMPPALRKQPLSEHAWLRWDEDWRTAAMERWAERNVPAERIAGRVDSTQAMHEMIVAGLGVGFLSCWLAEQDGRLVRLSDPEAALGLDLWLLTHRALRETARVRVVFEHLRDAIAAERPAIEGTGLIRGRSGQSA